MTDADETFLRDSLVTATRERDEARAALDSVLAEIDVWRGKLAEQCGQTLQARAIARRLAAALELSEPPWTPKTREALESFRTYPWAWAKDDA
jgi:hypothetical protein